MSYLTGKALENGAFTRRARALLCICGVFISGCVLEDPPAVREATQTRPYLFDFDPPLTQIVTVAGGINKQFSVGVRSEDAGEQIFGGVVENYDLPGSSRGTLTDIKPASTFEDTGRRVLLNWAAPANTPGCRQVTGVITHQRTWEALFLRPPDAGIADLEDDIATATWWVAVDGDFSNCPGNVGGQ